MLLWSILVRMMEGELEMEVSICYFDLDWGFVLGRLGDGYV